MKNETDYLCIGYVPLLYGLPQDVLDLKSGEDPAKIIADLVGEGAPSAKACLYCKYSDTITPVLVYDKAGEIFEHLKFWSEGKPEEWFDLHIGPFRDGYYISLVPRYQMSAERFKEGRFKIYGEFVPPDAKITMIFNYLNFYSLNIGMYQNISKKSSLYLGFLDAKDLNANDIQKTPPPDAFIGPIKVVKDGKFTPVLSS